MNTKILEFGSLILLQLSFNLVQLHSASSDLNYGSSSVGLLPAVSFYGVASAVRGSENFGEMGAVSLDWDRIEQSRTEANEMEQQRW